MNLVNLPAVMTSFLLLLSSLSRAAPPDATKTSTSDVGSDVGSYDDAELAKRLSSFVRIGRPSSFVRIGRGSHFVRIGRPGNFVRIGRGYEGSEDDLGDDSLGGGDYGADKRASRFVRIGKSSRFVRIGKSSGTVLPEDKRMSSFVRIGRGGWNPYDEEDLLNDDLNKRVSSFVRIGRSPSYVALPSDAQSSSDQTKA